MEKLKRMAPGIALTFFLAIPAHFLGQKFKIAGGPVFGILIGMLLAFIKRPDCFSKGIQFTSKKILQYAIIFIGFNMNLFSIFKTGSQTVILMMFTLSITFMTAYFFSKLLKVERKTAVLIGVGTSICGGSAIAATAPVIDANDEEIAFSISTIFLFNVLAAFIFPALGHILNMSDFSFGLWAGTAVNDTSSVVAAGYSFSEAAGDQAVIVKLTRTLAIIPITLILSLYEGKRRGKAEGFSIKKIFPWFILGFVLAAIMNTFININPGIYNTLYGAGKFMIIMAMTAIGLNTNIAKLIKTAGKPLMLGLICWIVLSISSLFFQHLFF